MPPAGVGAVTAQLDSGLAGFGGGTLRMELKESGLTRGCDVGTPGCWCWKAFARLGVPRRGAGWVVCRGIFFSVHMFFFFLAEFIKGWRGFQQS